MSCFSVQWNLLTAENLYSGHIVWTFDFIYVICSTFVVMWYCFVECIHFTIVAMHKQLTLIVNQFNILATLTSLGSVYRLNCGTVLTNVRFTQFDMYWIEPKYWHVDINFKPVQDFSWLTSCTSQLLS